MPLIGYDQMPDFRNPVLHDFRARHAEHWCSTRNSYMQLCVTSQAWNKLWMSLNIGTSDSLKESEGQDYSVHEFTEICIGSLALANRSPISNQYLLASSSLKHLDGESFLGKTMYVYFSLFIPRRSTLHRSLHGTLIDSATNYISCHHEWHHECEDSDMTHYCDVQAALAATTLQRSVCRIPASVIKGEPWS